MRLWTSESCELDILIKTAFEQQRPVHEERANDEATLEVLRSLGANLREIDLPNLAITATNFAAAFAEISAVWDEMIRRGQDAQLTRQDPGLRGQ